jgi:hypothetical protein
MLGATRRIAAATTVVLTAGLAVTLSPVTATAADAACAGMTAPANSRPLNQAPALANDTAKALAGTAVTIKVLANDSDPDGDKLYVTNVSNPAHGDACIQPNGSIQYLPDLGLGSFTETLTYGVTDGDLYRTAKLTVAVEGIKALRATLLHKLTVKKHKIKHRANVAFTNTNKRWVVVFAGSPQKKTPTLERAVAPGQTVSLRTRARRVIFVAAVRGADDDFNLISYGRINTVNGRQFVQLATQEDNEEFRTAPSMRTLAARTLR